MKNLSIIKRAIADTEYVNVPKPYTGGSDHCHAGGALFTASIGSHHKIRAYGTTTSKWRCCR